MAISPIRFRGFILYTRINETEIGAKKGKREGNFRSEYRQRCNLRGGSRSPRISADLRRDGGLLNRWGRERDAKRARKREKEYEVDIERFPPASIRCATAFPCTDYSL